MSVRICPTKNISWAFRVKSCQKVGWNSISRLRPADRAPYGCKRGLTSAFFAACVAASLWSISQLPGHLGAFFGGEWRNFHSKVIGGLLRSSNEHENIRTQLSFAIFETEIKPKNSKNAVAVSCDLSSRLPYCHVNFPIQGLGSLHATSYVCAPRCLKVSLQQVNYNPGLDMREQNPHTGGPPLALRFSEFPS